MRDLYFKLGIGRNATTEEIAAALELKPELNAYAPILLDKEKRAVYDRTHAALSAIGTLRRHLGLESGDSEFVKKYPDFSVGRRTQPPPASPSQPGPETPIAGETREAPAPGRAAAKSPAGSRWLLASLAALAAAIVLALLYLNF